MGGGGGGGGGAAFCSALYVQQLNHTPLVKELYIESIYKKSRNFIFCIRNDKVSENSC